MRADRMAAPGLESHLHARIPLAVAMQVSVAAVDSDGLTPQAPLMLTPER